MARHTQRSFYRFKRARKIQTPRANKKVMYGFYNRSHHLESLSPKLNIKRKGGGSQPSCAKFAKSLIIARTTVPVGVRRWRRFTPMSSFPLALALILFYWIISSPLLLL